jgi:hydroxymethylbilane synthase
LTKVRIATRASSLALIQARAVASRLAERGVETELVEVTTRGDADQASLLGPGLGAGAFVTAIEDALRDGRADLAVHSAKDLPTSVASGLIIAAFPERADPRDALVGAGSLDDLPAGARVGTSSARRRAFLRARWPRLRPVPIRGNVDTRLEKLDDGEYDALILAAAGLERLGLDHRIGARLGAESFPPCPSQGALAIECRQEDAARYQTALDDPLIRAQVGAERAVLVGLGGGCHSAIAALAEPQVGERFGRLRAAVAAADGSRVAATLISGPLDARLGLDAARDLIEQGALDLLRVPEPAGEAVA